MREQRVKDILETIDELVINEFTNGFGDEIYYKLRDELDKELFANSVDGGSK